MTQKNIKINVMKKKLLYVVVIILMSVSSYFLSTYGQPYLVGSKFEFISLNYLFMVPCMYFFFLIFNICQKYTNMKRLLILTIFAVFYMVVAEFFKIDKILEKMPAYLIGAAIMFLIMLAFKKK